MEEGAHDVEGCFEALLDCHQRGLRFFRAQLLAGSWDTLL